MLEITKDLFAVCPQCSATVFKDGKITNHCGAVAGDNCAIRTPQLLQHYKVNSIPLNDGSLSLIDARYLPLVKCYAWSIHRDGYAYGKVNGKNFYLHRFIYEQEFGTHDDLVDHISGNRLDNRIANLRRATAQENRRNTGKSRGSSRYIGVYYHKKRSKWCASIQHEGKNQHLGYFANEIDAAKAYNAFATLHYGEFAKLNEV